MISSVPRMTAFACYHLFHGSTLIMGFEPVLDSICQCIDILRLLTALRYHCPGGNSVEPSLVGSNIIMLKRKTGTLLENGNDERTKNLVHMFSSNKTPIFQNQVSFKNIVYRRHNNAASKRI